MKIGKLSVRIAEHETIGDHVEIRVQNSETEEYFVYDEITDTVKLRLTKDTALKLSQFIDETVEEGLPNASIAVN
jgi:hypothetical protein